MMVIMDDPGCPAVVGYNQPHDFKVAVLDWNPWCEWRLMFGKDPVITGYRYRCKHRMYCPNCRIEIPINPRECPDWTDRRERL